MLKPTTDNIKLVKYINDVRKTYSIFIDDDIPESKYRLNETYSQKRLKSSLQSILKVFPDASFFLIDDNSDFFASPSFNYIKLEIEKRKISVLLSSNLIHLNYDDEIQLENSFDNYLMEIGEGESSLFILSADGFRILLPEIERYRKTGVKIVHPSELIIASETPE